MKPDVSERRFEEAIEEALLAGGPGAPPGTVGEQAPGDWPPGGYRERLDRDYGKPHCLVRRSGTA